MTLKAPVQQAIAEIEASFSGHKIDVTEDGQGGARVCVHDLHVGDQYLAPASQVAFALTFQYPEADVYPHFVIPRMTRLDASALGPSFSDSSWGDVAATQVSRRSNNRIQDLETAVIKLHKVLAWIRSR